MATNQTFVDFSPLTPITADWLNNVNAFVNQGSLLPTVSSISALRNVSQAKSSRAFVFGYYAAGDQGGGPYYLDTTDTTSADNGGTIIVATDGGRWKLALTGPVPLTVFGAVPDNTTDSTVQIQNAITAFQGSTRSLVVNGKFAITSTLNITAKLSMRGLGQTQSGFRQLTNGANGITISFPSQTPGMVLSDFSIEAGIGWVSGGFQGTGSTGVGLYINNINTNGNFSNMNVTNFATSISVNQCWGNRFTNIECFYFQTAGLSVNQGGNGGDGRYLNMSISNNGFSGNNASSVGIVITSTGGEYFDHCDMTSSNVGIGVYASAAHQVAYLFFDSCLADSCVHNAIELDGSVGSLISTEFANCWASFSLNSAGLSVTGGGVASVQWNGGRIRENAGPGVVVSSSGGVYIEGAAIQSNSRTTANAAAGVAIGANVSNVSVIACRIGNAASSFANQGYSIAYTAGTCSNIRVIGNDLTNFGTGTGEIFNTGVTFTNSITANNI